jgi:hypothetical protein
MSPVARVARMVDGSAGPRPDGAQKDTATSPPGCDHGPRLNTCTASHTVGIPTGPHDPNASPLANVVSMVTGPFPVVSDDRDLTPARISAMAPAMHSLVAAPNSSKVWNTVESEKNPREQIGVQAQDAKSSV